MEKTIVERLIIQALKEPAFSSWREALDSPEPLFSVRLTPTDDVVAQAEEHLESCQEPIECDVCGGDCRRYGTQYFADINFGPELGLGQLRWFRVCEECGKRATDEDDPRITFMFRHWPDTDTEWRNGFVLGYRLEEEPWQGPSE